VLVVDDHVRPRRALATELEDAGFGVVQASDGAEAWEQFRQHPPDVVITDMVMPRSDGLDLLSRIRSCSDVPVILFTARGSVASAATAFKAGADDFVSSPDVEVEGLVALVEQAIAGARPSLELGDLEQRLVGRSRPISRLREQVSGLAPLRTPVLVSGEPGTGRDTVVRALHELGATAGSELLRVDTASFSPESPLPETGAVYLDGIERLSTEAQAYWTERVAEAEAAGFRDEPRILASTSGPLSLYLDDGNVYQELRGALLRFTIELPPLRVIADDVPEIADALVKRIGASLGRRIRLSASAREFLATQRWPGNARQLERLLERAIGFSRGRQVRREVVKDVLSDLEASLASIREQHGALERGALLRALQATGGNVTHTAEILGKSRSAVYRLIEKHGIPRSHPR
jgi:two-component system nitrogen regulation response regulator NtrX